MPSSEVKRIKRRQMPDGTVTGVWLGASRILGRPVPHAPVSERRWAVEGIWPYPHIHGGRTMAGHTFTSQVPNTNTGRMDTVVKDADGMVFKDGALPRPQKTYVSKRDCPACQAEWKLKRLRSSPR